MIFRPTMAQIYHTCYKNKEFIKAKTQPSAALRQRGKSLAPLVQLITVVFKRRENINGHSKAFAVIP